MSDLGLPRSWLRARQQTNWLTKPAASQPAVARQTAAFAPTISATASATSETSPLLLSPIQTAKELNGMQSAKCPPLSLSFATIRPDPPCVHFDACSLDAPHRPGSSLLLAASSPASPSKGRLFELMTVNTWPKPQPGRPVRRGQTVEERLLTRLYLLETSRSNSGRLAGSQSWQIQVLPIQVPVFMSYRLSSCANHVHWPSERPPGKPL